jgi:pimeloyl-ACP methyl ester carboxylesterase
VDEKVPWYARPVLRVRPDATLRAVEPATALRDYLGPLLIAVGEKDPDTVPELSRTLHAAANSPLKELIVVPGAGHYALGSAGGFRLFADFLDRHLE